MKNTMTKKLSVTLITIVALGALGLAGRADAETSTESAINSAINGAVTTNSNGQINNQTIPGSSLGSIASGLQNGDASPLWQYLITNQQFTGCAQNVENSPPGMQDSWTTAMAKWGQDLCAMYDCYEQALLISMLSTSSSNPQNGGTANQNQQCQIQQSIQRLAQSPPPSGLNCPNNSLSQVALLLPLITQNTNQKCGTN